MNAKQLKFLTLFEQMCAADPGKDATVKKSLPGFLSLDYALATDVWEYLCTTRETEIAKNKQLAVVLGIDVLDLFYRKAAPKSVKTLTESPVLRRAVYQYAPITADGTAFSILIDLLLGAKTAAADDIFKCLVKNEQIAYGAFLKKLLERLFIEILKKNPAKKIEMPRKLSALLLTYVAKIKTDERAMLEQRIRETM